MNKRVLYSDNEYMFYENEKNEELQQKAIQSYFNQRNSTEKNSTAMQLTHKNLKYFVESTPNYNGSINVSLILFNIQESDIFYGYGFSR